MAIYHEDSRAPKFGVLSQNLSSELLTLLRVFLSYCDPSRMPCVCLWLSILSSFLSPTSRMAGVRQLAKNKNKFKLKMKSQEELSTTEESLLLFLWCFLQRLLLRDTSSTNRKVREKPFSHVSSWFRKRPRILSNWDGEEFVTFIIWLFVIRRRSVQTQLTTLSAKNYYYLPSSRCDTALRGEIMSHKLPAKNGGGTNKRKVKIRSKAKD